MAPTSAARMTLTPLAWWIRLLFTMPPAMVAATLKE